MKDIKTLSDIDFNEKRVLVRVDFNTPLDSSGQVSDNTRIRAAIPTIQYLIKHNAKVILVSHLGRPKGERKPEYSLKPIAAALEHLISKPVTFVDDCIGKPVEQAVKSMDFGSVILLENVRFHPGEEANDPEFAKALSLNMDAFVNDAFGTAHREHASTFGVAQYLEHSAAGFLIAREIDYLCNRLQEPKRPFTVVLGGAKVSDKIQVIDSLLDKADTMLIGGAMAYTFALARGFEVGDSLVEPDHVETALKCIEKAKDKNVPLMLPVDTLITNSLDFKARTLGVTQVIQGNIPAGWEGVSIGPETVELFNKEIAKSGTILWNGPMGVFEIDTSAQGTFAIAKAIAESSAVSIIGGGDSVKAVNFCGYGDKVSFISTGGGASLELLEGKQLPGIKALEKEKSSIL